MKPSKETQKNRWEFDLNFSSDTWMIIIALWLIGAISYNIKDCKHQQYMHQHDKDDELDEEHQYTNE